MTVKDLQELSDYSWWANHNLLNVISQLPMEEFTRTIGGSYGSIRNTMVHLVSAEWGWLSRCSRSERGPALVPSDYPPCESLLTTWKKIEVLVRHLLSKLRDEDLGRVVDSTVSSSRPQSMWIGQLLHHTMVHGIHHRSQVALMLRMLG
jgi:uncharacterized damage-inducible protein DinB